MQTLRTRGTEVGFGTFEKSLMTSWWRAFPIAFQCKSATQNASERAPTKTRLMAQTAFRLNQLRDTNFSPR